MHTRLPGPALTLLLGLLACGGGAEDEELADEPLPACSELRSETFTAVSDDEGTFLVEIELEEGDLGFQVTLDDTDHDVYSAVTLVQTPENDQALDWEYWLGNEELLTGGVLPVAYSTAFDWPVRAEDGPLQSGTWLVKVTTLSDWNYAPLDGEDVEVTVHIKGPGELEQGCLDLRVLLADGIEEDDHVRTSIEDAMEQVAQLYEGQGIGISYAYETVELSGVLPSPGAGDEGYLDLASDSAEGELVMVIGDYLENSDQGVLGESGGAPGSLAPTERSVVAISWLMLAGGTGKFDDEEVSALSETMAHELGHYLGLHHPVNFDADGEPVGFDALDDTETCEGFEQCFAELGENLMFPYSLCEYYDSCEHQDQVSTDQHGVLIRYTGTL